MTYYKAGSDYNGSRFLNMTFTDFNFSLSTFSGAYFSNCIFNGGSFYGADLSYAKFVDCTFNNVMMNGSSLESAHLTRTHFSVCDLTDVNMEYATLNMCDLPLGVKLGNARLKGLYLEYTQLHTLFNYGRKETIKGNGAVYTTGLGLWAFAILFSTVYHGRIIHTIGHAHTPSMRSFFLERLGTMSSAFRERVEPYVDIHEELLNGV